LTLVAVVATDFTAVDVVAVFRLTLGWDLAFSSPMSFSIDCAAAAVVVVVVVVVVAVLLVDVVATLRLEDVRATVVFAFDLTATLSKLSSANNTIATEEVDTVVVDADESDRLTTDEAEAFDFVFTLVAKRDVSGESGSNSEVSASSAPVVVSDVALRSDEAYTGNP
jgi:hypothetical protein